MSFVRISEGVKEYQEETGLKFVFDVGESEEMEKKSLVLTWDLQWKGQVTNSQQKSRIKWKTPKPSYMTQSNIITENSHFWFLKHIRNKDASIDMFQ